MFFWLYTVNDKVGRNDFLTLKSDSVSSDRLSNFKPTQSPTADSQQKFQTDLPTQSPTTDSAYKTQLPNWLFAIKQYSFVFIKGIQTHLLYFFAAGGVGSTKYWATSSLWWVWWWLRSLPLLTVPTLLLGHSLEQKNLKFSFVCVYTWPSWSISCTGLFNLRALRLCSIYSGWLDIQIAAYIAVYYNISICCPP